MASLELLAGVGIHILNTLGGGPLWFLPGKWGLLLLKIYFESKPRTNAVHY